MMTTEERVLEAENVKTRTGREDTLVLHCPHCDWHRQIGEGASVNECPNCTKRSLRRVWYERGFEEDAVRAIVPGFTPEPA